MTLLVLYYLDDILRDFITVSVVLNEKCSNGLRYLKD